MLETFSIQMALAIEVTMLAAEARAASVLKEADQLKTTLLRTISHDLRTPLAAIKARTSSLLEGDVELDHSEWQESMRVIDTEADHLNRLVEDVMDLSRIEAGALQAHFETYAADEVVSAVISRVERMAKDHRLEIDVPADLPAVRLDIMLIGRVLSNLLENACKYSPAGSIVRLSAEASDGGLLFTVADQGAGIPTAQRERVFEPFYRIHRPLEVRTFGAGLGLAICRGIVAAHNGWIQVVEPDREGTAIRFWLPGERPHPVGSSLPIIDSAYRIASHIEASP
jgi:two-component system sensor histidine kinase KdpD